MIPLPRFAFLLASLLLAVSASAARVTEKFAQVHPITANGTVTLSNVNGDVEIEAWDRNEVSIEAEKSAANDEEMQRMQIKVEATADRVEIKTEMEKSWKRWRNFRGEVRYRVKVPAGVSLKRVEVVNSDVTVRGVKGEVTLDSVNGSIVAEGLVRPGRFDTVNGSIKVSYASLDGVEKIVLDTVNGGCSVTLPKDAKFEVNADSVNGRVSCEYPITLKSSGRRHLSGSVNGGGTKIVLDSVNGGLRILAAKG